jgi:hypothetical protein
MGFLFQQPLHPPPGGQGQRLNCQCGSLMSLVEVAGIEPASEGLQRAEPTCVSNPLYFRERYVRIGRSARPLALRVSAKDPKAGTPAYPAV